MIKLKQLIKESKKVKILIKIEKGNPFAEEVNFSVNISSNSTGVFVFLPKSSKDLDKLEQVDHNIVVDSLLDYLKKSTNLEFKWNVSYNTNGAGYGFSLDLEKILNKLK